MSPPSVCCRYKDTSTEKFMLDLAQGPPNDSSVTSMLIMQRLIIDRFPRIDDNPVIATC